MLTSAKPGRTAARYLRAGRLFATDGTGRIREGGRAEVRYMLLLGALARRKFFGRIN